jgi:hypothetical protein
VERHFAQLRRAATGHRASPIHVAGVRLLRRTFGSIRSSLPCESPYPPLLDLMLRLLQREDFAPHHLHLLHLVRNCSRLVVGCGCAGGAVDSVAHTRRCGWFGCRTRRAPGREAHSGGLGAGPHGERCTSCTAIDASRSEVARSAGAGRVRMGSLIAKTRGALGMKAMAVNDPRRAVAREETKITRVAVQACD